MMRVPGKIVTAVRATDREIVVREEEYESLARRYRLWGLPVLRGAISFFEMMIIGLKALNFSADVAMQQSEAGDAEDGRAGVAAVVGMLEASACQGVVQLERSPGSERRSDG